MKILRLTTLLDFGGQEKKYISFTEKPQILQNEYVFAAIGYGGNAEKTLKERGFEVHILNRNFSIKNLSNIWAVYKLIKKINPDVVHTAAAEANFHGIIAAKLAGVKMIIGEEIGIPNHSKTAQWVFRQVYTLANKVIGVSEAVKNHLVKIKEIPETKGVVLYNPVSLPNLVKVSNLDKVKATLENSNLEKLKAFNIVYVGRLEKVKNVTTLIKAFAQIENQNSQLTIVGDGRERQNLENLTKELGLSDRVRFEGFQSEPAQFLSAADLYVLPSYSEGFGIAAVEAMFLKVPVLATNIGGIPEFITDGENGWLFNPNDEVELANKLRTLSRLEALTRLKQVGEKGYQSAINTFTVEKYVKSLEEIYL